MNGKRFDHLARDVAASGSRRRLLGALLAGALGGLRLRITAADDSGTAIADASGGNNNLSTTPEQDTSKIDHDSNPERDHTDDNHDGDDKRHDNGKDRGHEHDGCNDADCPPDESTSSKGAGFCCDDGFCSCGGECCGGPDCWIVTTQVSGGDEITVRELCNRPHGCLQCSDSGSQCCTDCTASGHCVSPCISCPGEPSADVCCGKCNNDPAIQCEQIPDTFPISGGRIRRR